MPKVSVVLPVFNGVDTISRSIGSILDQTLNEIELIVVDDGSTDKTVSVVQRFADPRVKLVQSSHRGVAAAANSAVQYCSAQFIARMDADDFSYPQRLEHQLNYLKENGCDVVGCQVRILNQSFEPACTMDRYQRWVNEETLVDNHISALRFVEFPLVNPTILARRRYFEIGFIENDFPEDYDLMLRAAAKGFRFGKVGEVLLDWIDRPDGLTRTDPRYSTEAFVNCRRTHLLSGPLRGIRCVDLWGLGQTGKPWLRWLQDQGISVRRGYEVNERKINLRIHGVPVVHPDEMPSAEGTPLIVAVGAGGARELILPHIVSRGYVSGQDAWFVA